MKIETSDTPLPRSRYQGFIEELLKGKTIINLEHKFYNSIRQACYKQELNLVIQELIEIGDFSGINLR